MSEQRKPLSQIITTAVTDAYQSGYGDGYADGEASGFLVGLQYGAAIERQKYSKLASEALKLGSSEAGRIMQREKWGEADELAGYDFRDDRDD